MALLAAAAPLTDPTQIAGNSPSDRRQIGSPGSQGSGVKNSDWSVVMIGAP